MLTRYACIVSREVSEPARLQKYQIFDEKLREPRLAIETACTSCTVLFLDADIISEFTKPAAEQDVSEIIKS